ncbi:MAG: cysteine--tRNA ligase [Candidatus Omnitrophica bacterium]|nr:cysteine--tRNA ligase [Candidatus Omnitrophota bacterium]
MRIYNTLTRNKKDFQPIKKGEISIYVCGPTVYDEPHIGHARSAYVFDVIRRYLKYKDKGCKIKFVRNVTDIDDKIINKAKEACASGDLKTAVKEISQKYLASYTECMDRMGILKPYREPKATEYIEKMKKFIALLIKRKAAYVADGDVYFDIKKAKNYGKLSNQNLEKMEAGARIASGENKKDPLDFALWKKAKVGEPSWPSPWGEGRPGWHIECSVMSSDIFGGEFDIHAGGIDLIFPHHENEIAQSEGAGKKFAKLWMHNGLLTINAEKMAKSLGNFITIKDFETKYKDLDLLKLLFINSHYRSPVDYTEEKIKQIKKAKERIKIFVKFANKTMEKIERDKGKPNVNYQGHSGLPWANKYKLRFESAMDDDFNTPKALAEIFSMIHEGNSLKVENTADTYLKLKCFRDVLTELLAGIFGLSIKEDSFGEVEKILMKEYEEFRKQKNFKKSDEFRHILLNEYNIIVEDTKEGPVWRKKL